MRIRAAIISLLTCVSSEPLGLRGPEDSADEVFPAPPRAGESALDNGHHRHLNPCCYSSTVGHGNVVPEPDRTWHPVYAAGWEEGYCELKSVCDCYSPSYPTQKQCCDSAFAEQPGGHCLSQLPVTDPTCSTGILGGDGACCSVACGSCGGTGCAARPGGASGCCGGTILDEGRSCDDHPPPCVVGVGAGADPDCSYRDWRPVYTAEYEESYCELKLVCDLWGVFGYPTQKQCCDGFFTYQQDGHCLSQLPVPDPTCSTGILGGDGTCCSAACGSCGGTGCSARPGGASGCCGGDILDEGRSCDDHPPPCVVGAGADPDCSVGVVGGGGSVCCIPSCGTCGGTGCGSRPGGPSGCCTGRIRSDGMSCDEHLPPCVMS